MITDPMGRVIAETEETDYIIYAVLEPGTIEESRITIPAGPVEDQAEQNRYDLMCQILAISSNTVFYLWLITKRSPVKRRYDVYPEISRLMQDGK